MNDSCTFAIKAIGSSDSIAELNKILSDKNGEFSHFFNIDRCSIYDENKSRTWFLGYCDESVYMSMMPGFRTHFNEAVIDLYSVKMGIPLTRKVNPIDIEYIKTGTNIIAVSQKYGLDLEIYGTNSSKNLIEIYIITKGELADMFIL